VVVLLQMSSRPSKASLDKAAADAQLLPVAAAAAPSSRVEAGDRAGADLALIWTLQGEDGRPARIGAHHFYDLQEKVCRLTYVPGLVLKDIWHCNVACSTWLCMCRANVWWQIFMQLHGD
jgi:hypothetical protein